MVVAGRGVHVPAIIVLVGAVTVVQAFVTTPRATSPTFLRSRGPVRALRMASTTSDDSDRPVWTHQKNGQRFRPLREDVEGVSNVAEPIPPPMPSATSFVGFKLREVDESDAAWLSGDAELSLRGVLWFLALLWPNIAFGILCSTVSEVIVQQPDIQSVLPDLKQIHGFVGTILGFTIGFRTSAAYDRYYEGRKVLSVIMESSRSIIRDAYSFLLKPDGSRDDGASRQEVARVCEDVRRRLDILFAFIRQSVRESKFGFAPDSGMSNVTFNDNTFFLDPSRPQLLDLLNKAEADRYSLIPPRARPGAVFTEINVILQLLGQRFQFCDTFIGKTQSALHEIVAAHSSMIRIRDTPLPYPYVIILRLATFLFVYATPFIYSGGYEGRYFGVQFLVFSYYGILRIGESIENPFAYDTFDIDMEAFARNLHNDMKCTALAYGEDMRAFMAEYFDKRGT